MDSEYKKFGLKVAEYVDGHFLYGVGGLSIGLIKLIQSKLAINKPPLDWNGERWQEHYYNESSILWITKNDKKLYLPQKIILGPWDGASEIFDTLDIFLETDNFIPEYKNEKCLQFYIKEGDFNGENARLIKLDRENKSLVFQGAKYFDWVSTNLSLDHDTSPLPTLRDCTSLNGRLHDLENSPLVNITGINGLIFTKDGYMVYQKRNGEVLVRPNQLCSGFSGTIDKIDIEHVIRGERPVLQKMDTAREAVEEVGIDRSNIKDIQFLGITRELIRGGTPELFYSIDLDLTRKEVLGLIPKDKEGSIQSVFFGMYAKSKNSRSTVGLNEQTLWQLLDSIERETKAPISIPFLTNLALWYWQWDEKKVGASDIALT
jgi:hypothetical protein